MAKKYICPQCDNEFSTRQSLWKHKQKRRCHGQSARTSSQPPPTFIAAAVEESSLERRPKNPRIQALLDEIVNGDDSKRHVPQTQVIHKGFSIIAPTTKSSRSSKSSRQLAPESQSTLTTREEPGMKKIKLSSSARSKEDIAGEKKGSTITDQTSRI